MKSDAALILSFFNHLKSVFICGKKSFLPLIIDFQTGSKAFSIKLIKQP
jgi:hypothetical protein